MPWNDVAQIFCCGICTACAGVGLATVIFAAYIAYYVLTTIFGCIIIYYGVALKNLLVSYNTFIDAEEDYLLYSNLCISIGAMFTIVVVLGLCAQRSNMSEIMVFSSLMQLVVLVIGIYSYFWAYPGTEKIERFLSSGFDSALDKYSIGETSTDWDQLQKSLECCGKLNFKSWEGKSNLPGGAPPISCCRAFAYMESCSDDVKYHNPGYSAIVLNVQGCMPKVQDEMIGQMKTLQKMFLPFLLVTLIGFGSSLCNAGAKKATSTEGQKVGGLYVNVPTKAPKEGDEEGEKGVGVIAIEMERTEDDNEGKNEKEDEEDKPTKT